MRYDRSDWLWIFYGLVIVMLLVFGSRIGNLDRRITECEKRLTVLELKAGKP